MTASTITAPSAAFASFQDIGETLVSKLGVKYSRDRCGPYTSPEDFTQEIWSRFWEWLGDPDHLDQAISLLEDTVLAQRFLHQFSRARICDLIDLSLAGPRDQRLTLQASAPIDKRGGNSDSESVSLLEHLAYAEGHVDNPCTYIDALDVMRKACEEDSDARLLLATILEHPPELRAAFLEARLRLCRGMATLTESDTPDGVSVLLLSIIEGYVLDDAEVTWIGPLITPRWQRRSVPLATSQGPAAVSMPDPGTVVITWDDTKLTVQLDVVSHEGEFLREVIRPSPKVFDLNTMKDYLGISGLRIREAWTRLQILLKDNLGRD